MSELSENYTHSPSIQSRVARRWNHPLLSKLAGKPLSGFTLAEMLITLAIIGTIAAIILPALIKDTQDKDFTAAREKAVYNIREAVRGIVSNNSGVQGFVDSNGFKNELAKYLAVSKSCNDLTIDSSCFPTTIKSVAGVDITTPVSGATLGLSWGAGNPIADPGSAAGLILNNGTALNITYNSACNENTEVYDSNNNRGQNHVCANIIFDTNGFKAPNQVGKDIGFVTIINPTNTVITGVVPDNTDLASANWTNAQTNCLAKRDTWHLPTKDELNSLHYNKIIIDNLDLAHYWSSTVYTSDPAFAWSQNANTENQLNDDKSNSYKVRCVRR